MVTRELKDTAASQAARAEEWAKKQMEVHTKQLLELQEAKIDKEIALDQISDQFADLRAEVRQMAEVQRARAAPSPTARSPEEMETQMPTLEHKEPKRMAQIDDKEIALDQISDQLAELRAEVRQMAEVQRASAAPSPTARSPEDMETQMPTLEHNEPKRIAQNEDGETVDEPDVDAIGPAAKMLFSEGAFPSLRAAAEMVLASQGVREKHIPQFFLRHPHLSQQ